jgi:hypothetical protein
MQVEYNINKVQDTSYPLAQYGLLDVHRPVAPGLTVSECDTCQRVKASHLKASGTLQPLPIPSWKWEDISMDFIVGLPNTSQKHDSIWVIIDRLTKTAHFLPVHTTYSAKKYAEVYLDQIVRLHGVPKTIISDRGP